MSKPILTPFVNVCSLTKWRAVGSPAMYSNVHVNTLPVCTTVVLLTRCWCTRSDFIPRGTATQARGGGGISKNCEETKKLFLACRRCKPGLGIPTKESSPKSTFFLALPPTVYTLIYFGNTAGCQYSGEIELLARDPHVGAHKPLMAAPVFAQSPLYLTLNTIISHPSLQNQTAIEDGFSGVPFSQARRRTRPGFGLVLLTLTPFSFGKHRLQLDGGCEACHIFFSQRLSCLGRVKAHAQQSRTFITLGRSLFVIRNSANFLCVLLITQVDNLILPTQLCRRRAFARWLAGLSVRQGMPQLGLLVIIPK